jgi:hypothetical protein
LTEYQGQVRAEEQHNPVTWLPVQLQDKSSRKKEGKEKQKKQKKNKSGDRK